jgi:hypothetical protein
MKRVFPSFVFVRSPGFHRVPWQVVTMFRRNMLQLKSISNSMFLRNAISTYQTIRCQRSEDLFMLHILRCLDLAVNTGSFNNQEHMRLQKALYLILRRNNSIVSLRGFPCVGRCWYCQRSLGSCTQISWITAWDNLRGVVYARYATLMAAMFTQHLSPAFR